LTSAGEPDEWSLWIIVVLDENMWFGRGNLIRKKKIEKTLTFWGEGIKLLHFLGGATGEKIPYKRPGFLRANPHSDLLNFLHILLLVQLSHL
jgi:hypothetical protein